MRGCSRRPPGRALMVARPCDLQGVAAKGKGSTLPSPPPRHRCRTSPGSEGHDARTDRRPGAAGRQAIGTSARLLRPWRPHRASQARAGTRDRVPGRVAMSGVLGPCGAAGIGAAPRREVTPPRHGPAGYSPAAVIKALTTPVKALADGAAELTDTPLVTIAAICAGVVVPLLICAAS